MLDLNNYLLSYKNLIFSNSAETKLVSLQKDIEKISQNNKVFVFGNGGSAAIADHFAVDMTKNAGITTLSLNTSSLITCFANDYGYDQWMKQALKFYAKPGDMVFLISSSGNSQNVVNACQYANKNNIQSVTFTGFSSDNSLKSIGKVNFWVDAKSYNIVENIHQIWMLSIVDLIIGKSEYSAS